MSPEPQAGRLSPAVRWLLAVLFVSACVAVALRVADRGSQAPTPAGDLCGNGRLDRGEICDPGAADRTDCSEVSGLLGWGRARCTPDCRWDLSGCSPTRARCGDGRLGPGEACDPPGSVAPCGDLVPNASGGQARCTPDCRWDDASCLDPLAVCGNDLVEPGELCDDGNLANGDGCSEGCAIEIEGTPVHYDGPQVDARIEAWAARSPCREASVRNDARRGPRVMVRYQLLVCQLASGEDAYPLERIRAVMARARGAFAGAGIELVESRVGRVELGPDCRVAHGDPAIAEVVGEALSRHEIPVLFVSAITGGPTPGLHARGFAAPGYAAVLGTTRPEVAIHELGHVFGLLHTHACLGGPQAFGGDCERTGDRLCDTPYDPGPRWYPLTCPGAAVESCSVDCGNEACSSGAEPDRANYMSYYDGCLRRFSAEQLDLARCFLDHDLVWFRGDGDCSSERCNGADDDCDGLVDEDEVCAAPSSCERAETLTTGRTVGTTAGRGEAFGGEDYPEGSPDVLFAFEPSSDGPYCLQIAPLAAGDAAPIVTVRDGCEWDAAVRASNLERSGRPPFRARPTLELSARAGETPWIGVDGWGPSGAVAFALELRAGPCHLEDALEVPRLLEPSDGARPAPGPVALRWRPVAGAEAYEVRLGLSTAGLGDDPPCPECSAQIVEAPGLDLLDAVPDRRVYWTVRALRGSDSGPFARPRHFRARRDPDEPALLAPRLLAPEPNALLPTLTETFTWEPVEGAAYYELRLGIEPERITRPDCGACQVTRSPLPEVRPDPRFLSPSLDYVWTVRAVRGPERGPFADPRAFHIEGWLCTSVGRLEPPSDNVVEVLPNVGDVTGSCGGDSRAEHVWLLVPERSGPLCIDTEGTSFDTVLYVRQRCEQPETEVACNDDGLGLTGGPSRLIVDGVEGEPLFVIVDGYGPEDYGEYVLRAREGRCP